MWQQVIKGDKEVLKLGKAKHKISETCPDSLFSKHLKILGKERNLIQAQEKHKP